MKKTFQFLAFFLPIAVGAANNGQMADHPLDFYSQPASERSGSNPVLPSPRQNLASCLKDLDVFLRPPIDPAHMPVMTRARAQDFCRIVSACSEVEQNVDPETADDIYRFRQRYAAAELRSNLTVEDSKIRFLNKRKAYLAETPFKSRPRGSMVRGKESQTSWQTSLAAVYLPKFSQKCVDYAKSPRLPALEELTSWFNFYRHDLTLSPSQTGERRR